MVRFGKVPMVSHADPAEFMRLYSQHENRIRGYVRSLVPRWSDAEDVTQQCNLIMWQQFQKFELGTSFFAWACQIVRFKVLKYRRSGAQSKLVFGDAAMDAVTARTVEHQEELQIRLEYLQSCVAKLSKDRRELLRLYYDERRSVGSIAALLNRSTDGIYKTLTRIRLALHECIDGRLAEGRT